MSAPIIEIADEIVDQINDLFAGLFAGQVQATRQYNPLIDLKDIGELRCIVYTARNLSEVDLTRGRLRQHEYEIQILVQSKLPPPSTDDWFARIDELTELTEEIADVFRPKPYLGTTESYPIAIDIDPVFAIEHLNMFNIFSSQINLTIGQARR